jgi:hypothetical protein
MSGITRQQLKSVVKECLLEILSEGMGTSLNESIRTKSANVTEPYRKNPSLDRKVVSTQKRAMTDVLKETIRAEAAGNMVLADILSDTARTTLPAMLESDSSRGAYLPPTGQVERKVASSTPEQLFGEDAASKWAQLAFAENTKNRG